MTIAEFNEITNRLCNLFNKELNEIQLEFWFKNLKDYDAITYRRAIGEYAKKNKYLPTISDILDSIRTLKPLEKVTETKVECKACKSTGYILYKKVLGGIEYEYASQCNCANGDKVAYNGKNSRERTEYYLAKATDIFKANV